MSMSLRVALLTVIISSAAAEQTPDALFQSKCANCHSAVSAVGAPLPETLRQMSWQNILAALETGKMKGVGETLTAVERDSIAKFLGTADAHATAASAKCAGAPARAAASGNWNGWADAANTRFQPAKPAG